MGTGGPLAAPSPLLPPSPLRPIALLRMALAINTAADRNLLSICVCRWR